MGASAATVRQQIEAKLSGRIPGALTPLAQQLPRLHPSGIDRLDLHLSGGWPLGSVCEVTGDDGSGRSSVALSLLAAATSEGACAYLDVGDSLSVQSAAAAGIRLCNLLWVRFAGPQRQSPQTIAPRPLLPAQSGRSTAASESRPQQNCGSPHPRGETKGLAPALEQLLFDKEERRRRKMEGTPGYPNQPLGLHTASQDQVEWERFNFRRVDENDPLRRTDQDAAAAARLRASRVGVAKVVRKEHGLWDRLDQALRATDQVLQSGGFRVVILDLASIPAEKALRIPSATWWRFQKAAQVSDAILMLLSRQPCARSSAACVLECAIAGPPKVEGVLAGFTMAAATVRQRTGPAAGKKAPGRVTSWEAAPLWMRAAGR